MKLRLDSLLQFASDNIPSAFLVLLDSNLKAIKSRSDLQPLVIREFINTTVASVTRNLPNGMTSPDKDYHFVKTDATANTITIVPFGTQKVMATTSLILNVQGDSAWLAFDLASQSWWLV